MKIKMFWPATVLAAALLACNVAATADQDANAVWVDYSTFGMQDDGDLNHATISVSSSGKDHVYDVIGPVKFCAADSGFFCIHGGALEVAVPKHNLKPTEQWRFGKTLFKVVPRHMTYDDFGGMIPPPPPPGKPDIGKADREMKLVGDSISYYEIQAIPDDASRDCHTVYFYSPIRGLVGFRDSCKDERPHIRLIQQQFGPGSPQFDAKISPEAFLKKEDLANLAK